MMTNITIDFFSELSCPWCMIGLFRLDKVLAEHFPALTADIVHHPVYLSNDIPAEGQRIADLLLSKHGISDPAVAWDRPHAEARASGLALDLSLQPMAYSNRAAHTLIRLARSRGTQHKLAVDITSAYFQEARNISDPDVLASIATRHGFEAEEVRSIVTDPLELEQTDREAGKASAAGVRMVPHVIFPGGSVLIGGRSEAEVVTALEKAMISQSA